MVSGPVAYEPEPLERPAEGKGENAWRVVWKMKNGARDEAVWSVTPDGHGLSMIGGYHDNDGKTYPINKTYQREGGNGGLVGKWRLPESADPSQAFRYLELRTYESDGLSFAMASGKVFQNLKFDGKEYPDLSTPNAFGIGRRLSSHSFELTDKLDGKITAAVPRSSLLFCNPAGTTWEGAN